ncbi:M23 family metallopeptidase [Candidatus Poriferisocius sp.]|uniref:M23 family metallopeptidase n=1 Tax=Candidatus Poriferisocius sp. TaxID=3101276 RepID=UPI003B017D1F
MAGRGLVRGVRRGWNATRQALGGFGLRRTLGVLAVLGVAFGLGIVVSRTWIPGGSGNDGRTGDPTGDPPAGSATVVPAIPQPTPTPTTTPPPSATPTPTTTSTPTATPAPTPTATPAPSPTPVFVVLEREPPPFEQALEFATTLAPRTSVPSDCMSPLPHPALLPNSSRNYRSGIHQGVDFRCFARGHEAVAALDGRIVVVVGEYADPDPNDRIQLLDIAAQVGNTPPYTLLTLYGNYVVIDHGIISGVGHVVSIYAHLEEVDPNIRVGQLVEAGHTIGLIGNRGTHAAANGDLYDDPHLHWELHIDNQFLGAGLSVDETRKVYTTLFAPPSG